MSSAVNVKVKAILAKVEPSYSGSTTPSTATDGIQLVPTPNLTITNYTFDGARPDMVGSLARLGATGRTMEGSFSIEGKGQGAAYTTSSASVPNLHPFLLASGLSASLSASALVFKPTSPDTAQTSLQMNVYDLGTLRIAKGVYCDYKVGTDSADAPKFEFTVKGIAALPTTTAVPSITYLKKDVLPPRGDGSSLSINGITSFKLRKWSFELGRDLSPRTDLQDGNAHAGFAPGGRAPKFSVTIEAPLLSTFDAYAAHASGSILPVSLTIGSVAGNRYTLNIPQAQLMDVKDSVDGNAGTLDLVFDCTQTGPLANDDFSLVWS